MATIKKKRVSKKTKKSWRKNVDIQDVENFLEDQRLEERLGVKYSEQKDDDLFHIDTKGKDENVQTENNVPVDKPRLKKSSHSMRLKESETPKCFEALVKRSAVPPHIINKTRIKKENSKCRVARTIIKRKTEKEMLKAKNKLSGEDISKKQNEPKRAKFSYDVWAKNNSDKDLNGYSEWLSNDTIRHTLHNTGKCKKLIPKTAISKTSLLPAVEAPHPGLSYNPSVKDHKAILEAVIDSEVKVINEEKHLNRVTTKMFNKLPREVADKQWLSEMTVGLSAQKSESDEEDVGDYKAVNSPVKNKKKTLQKRKKLKEQMLLREKLKQRKIEKKKISDIYKLRKFKEILDKKEEKILKNIERHKLIKEKKHFTTKLLSQVKYQEPEIDFNLAEELSGNLRNIKTEGSILYDRFKSLQKRNILQPSLKRRVKRRKMKKYERAHTKMGWEPQGYVPFQKNTSLKK